MSDENRFDIHFEQARREIMEINRQAYGAKKRVILQLAENLEKDGMPQSSICRAIVEKRLASPRLVRRSLDDKYKDATQAGNAKKQARKKVELVAAINGKVAAHVPPNVSEEPLHHDSLDNSRESHHHNSLPSPRNNRSRDLANMADRHEDIPTTRTKSNQLTRVIASKQKMDEMRKIYDETEKRCYLYLDSNMQIVKVEADTQTYAWKRRAIEKKANFLACLEAQRIRLGA